MRQGISGALNAADVEASSQNTHRVLNALKADAAIGCAGTTTWYEVTRTGFNFVDPNLNNLGR
jgi:hypothetical protein